MMNNLQNLSVDELSQLNRALIPIHKAKSRVRRATVASNAIVDGRFQIGDVIEFYKSGRGRSAGFNYFRFDKMNRNGDCMQGPPCDEEGKVIPGMGNWTVGVTQPTLKVIIRNGKPV